MKVYAARFYEIYDEESKKMWGKDTPIGMSLMAAAMTFMTIFLFFVMFIPTITEPDVKYRPMGIIIWVTLCILSSYFAYDVYGNYLYYKGIVKDPPFAKSSVRIFWRDVKKGKKPYLLLSERKGSRTIFHVIQKGLFRRGVIVDISDEELEEVSEKWIKKLRGEKDKISELRFEYKKDGIKEMKIEYKDGKEIIVGKREAELLGVLIYLGRQNYTYLANVGEIMDIRTGSVK